MTTVYLVAPTPMLQAGLRTLLAVSGIEIAGEGPRLAIPPAGIDVILLADIEALEDLVQTHAGARLPAVLVFSAEVRAVTLLRRLPVKAWGLLPPESQAADVQGAVLAAAAGLTVLPAALADSLLGVAPASEMIALDSSEEPLTPREREVLELLSQGHANKQIARALHISEHTVKFHVSSIYAKLGAASRTEAVNRGAHRGLITL